MREFQSRVEAVPQLGAVNDEKTVTEKVADEEKLAHKQDSDAKSTDTPPRTDGHETDTDVDSIDKDAQAGVQKMEATTKVWTWNHVIAAYILIWIIYFIDALQQGTGFVMTPFITSEFQQHSLTATTQIFSSLIGGLTKLPLAKILDIWGRPQGFILMMLTMMLGLIMMAACQNVETFAAAQVFYWVGFNGMSYTLSVFIADTSALKNRGLMLGFISSPYIITTWIAGPFAESFLKGPGFRWAFGIFVIVTPVMCAPLIFLFLYNQHKAKKMGLLPARNSGRTVKQSLYHYAVEFDVVGLLLITGGLSLMLVAFSTYSLHGDKWASPLIICFIVFGFLLLVGFAVWERYWAPVKFFPFHLLFDRTVLGACLLSATLFVSWYIWNAYFSSFLQVVNGLSVTQSSYIGNIYSIGACFWSIVVGVAIRYTGRFKWIALYFGVPVTILGVGLMVHFRQPDVYIGYIAMCQVFIALGGGALVICEQVAAMAAVNHQYIATVLAIEGMFTNVGGAIGQTVAAAIWTGVFPFRLAQYLPAEDQGNLTAIYGSIYTQMSYEPGTPTRNAINQAYGDAQRMMLIAATSLHIISILSVVAWRNIDVKNFKQVKGRVI